MAFHGGNLEAGTDQVARAVAERTGASLYTVCQPEGLRWHIPSVAFRPDESAALAAFVDHVDVVITVHGFGRQGMFRSLLLGGRNRELAADVAGTLRRALPHYEIIDELDDIPPTLRGLHADNPVNLTRGTGIQIELPPRVRGSGPFWNSWPSSSPTPHTEALVDALSDVVGRWQAV